jgi:hypothetical protein
VRKAVALWQTLHIRLFANKLRPLCVLLCLLPCTFSSMKVTEA